MIGQRPSSRNKRGSIDVERKRSGSRRDQQRGIPVDEQALLRPARSQARPARARACARTARARAPMPATTPGTATAVGALHVAIVDDRGPGEQIRTCARPAQRIVGGIERHRRAHAVVDGVGLALVGAPQHHAPPAAIPLIHGSTTPIAKESATAASTASPPFASTAAPTSAARRCCAATTPPRVGMTALRTICEFGEIVHDIKLARVVAREADDVGVRGEPDAAVRLAWRISSSRIQTRER